VLPRKIAEAEDRFVGCVIEPDYPDIVVAQLLNCRWQTRHHAHGEIFDGACSSLRGARRDVYCAVTRKDHCVDACSFTRTQDCAEIAWVSHPIDCDKEELLRSTSNHIVKQRFFEWFGESNHSLRCLTSCLLIDLLSIHIAHYYSLRARQVDDFGDYRIAFTVVGDKNFAHSAT
jgi:hypothetical protein